MEQVDPVEALFERARQNRVPMAQVCRRANVAQTTPSRWKRNKNGATIGHLRKLNEALSEIIEEATTAVATDPSPGNHAPDSPRAASGQADAGEVEK